MTKQQSKLKEKSVKKWFGLNQDGYTVDEIATDFVAFNRDLAKNLLRRAERSLITGKGLKLVLLHKRGDGKTHMANYVANTLSERGLVKKIYLANPPMSRGSKYLELHRAIMKAFQDDNIIPSVFEKALVDPNREISELLSASKDLLKACIAYKKGTAKEAELLRYLSGEALTSVAIRNLSVTGKLDSPDALKILRVIANLYWNIEGKMLMLIVDEVDNLKEVTLGARDFKEAFRQIAEMPKLSVILIFNVAPKDKLSMEVLPSSLKDTGVVTRIGSRNYMIAPEVMRIAELLTFVVEVTKRLKGEGFEKALKRALKDYGKDEIDPELFPFTNTGFQTFQEKVQKFLSKDEIGRALLPRTVLSYVNECCAEATLLGKTAIDKNVIEKVGDFGQ